MQDVVNVNPRAVIDQISMVRCDYGSNIALYVDDIDKAAAYLREKNVRTMQGPIPITEGCEVIALDHDGPDEIARRHHGLILIEQRVTWRIVACAGSSSAPRGRAIRQQHDALSRPDAGAFQGSRSRGPSTLSSVKNAAFQAGVG